MKFNFRKISAIGASLLMAGMTAGIAAAATYPAPFVNNGVADVAIVYGTGAGVSTLDSVEAGNIQTNLGTFVTGTSGSTAVTEGDSVQISKPTNSFNLGDNLNSFYLKIDNDQLGTILKDGVYKNDDNDEFDYSQKVVLGSMNLTHFSDSKFNNKEPVIGFNLDGGTTILNYTLDFTPDNAESSEADWDSLEGTTIEMLGKEYYVLSASNSTGGSESLDLLDSANSASLKSGETKTVQAGANSYDVSIDIIDGNSVQLIVDGVSTGFLDEGETARLDSGDYIGIKEVVDSNYAGDTDIVEFSIGSGKISLENNKEVEVNGDKVSDIDEYEGNVLKAYVTPSTSGDLDKFTIEWKLDSGNSHDAWLAFDTNSTEMVMPVFNNLKLSLGNFVTDAEELTSVNPDGDDSFTLDTTVTDGDVSLNLLYANSTGTGFEGIGEDSTDLLITNSSSDPTISWNDDSSYFVATWIDGDNAESYVLEVSDIDDSTPSLNSTTITSLADGSNKAITLDIGDEDEIGQISFTLNEANANDNTATIVLGVAGSSSGTVTADKLVTAEGMKIQLPQETDSSSAGYINLTAQPSDWVMNFTEETESGNIDGGNNFDITLGFNDDKTTVSSVSVDDYETTDGSDDYVGYVESDLATKTMFYTGDDQDNVDITYHGTEATAEVFLSELGATFTSGGASTLGNVLVLDSEVSSVSDKNLIVVGGSCINSAAAALVGEAACGERFTELTGVGMGQFLVKGYASSSITDKLAVLVAGYDAADTQNAATYLTTQTVDTSSSYIGTTGSTAELQVETA